MALPNITLMSSTQGKTNLVGEPAVVCPPIRTPGRLFTVSITTSNFIGRIFIEATLKSDPSENDWFPIPSATYDFTTYTTGTKGVTFTGSFAKIRARMDRSHMGLGELSDINSAPYGYIDNIILNMGSRNV